MSKRSIGLLLLATWLTHSNSEYIPPGPRFTCPKDADRQLIHPCICEKGTDDGLFVRCENSGLATLSVGLGNIAGLKLPVESLVLKECRISRLFGPLLQRSSVRVLRIVDTPLTSVEADAFVGVNRTLQELYIVNSSLQRFPKEAVSILGNLSTLYLDGHEIPTLEKDIFADSLAAGTLVRLHVVNGHIGDVPTEPFQHLKKLKTLDLHGNRIATLKKNQFKGLRDAEVLDLSHNNITKLDGSHLGDLTKMGWCNVSHNNIGEITRGMFARNALLKVLHLNGNRLKKLDTNSFRGMRFLRRLYLQDNRITDVGRGTFGSITRIGTIDLARNLIAKVDFQMFYQLNYVEIIDLSENQITSIEKQSFKDLYQTWINISHNQLANMESNSFENCGNMTLDLSYNNLTEINKNAFDFNTYALEFQLSYNALTELNQVPIHNMTGLKVLNVSHNRIHTIPRATFPKLYELHTVDLSHNELTDIFSSVFQSLFSLRFLNLSHNHLEQVKPSTFGTLPTVLELDLSHNRLRDVSRGALAKLASCARLDVSHNALDRIFQLPISLGELDFSFNNLSEIKANTWPSMNALLRLNLSHNRLGDNLDSDSLRSLLTVLKLDLSSNGLTRPPWEALSPLSSLQYLIMRDNALTSLNKAAFGRLPVVFQLDLTSNHIDSVSPLAFDGLLQLLDLSLRNNSLGHVPNEAFKGLVSMTKLDLSHNQLEKIDNRTHGLLDDCLSLEKVDLSHNAFSFLTRKMFPSNPYIPYKLSEVDLSHNRMPVLTGDIAYGTKRLRRLSLAHNNINDIRKDVLVNLTSLEYLDLSGNSLSDLTSQAAESVFRLPEHIISLNLSDNQLAVLPAEQLAKAESLRMLDIRQNLLETFDLRLVKRVRDDGLQVLFDGNPLLCDCFARPLKHHLSRRGGGGGDALAALQCRAPPPLAGAALRDVDEDRLLCGSSVETAEKMATLSGGEFDFVAEPDVVFRDVQLSQETIYLQWYILGTEDIADFLVLIRDQSNHIFYNQAVSYALRTLSIDVAGTPTLKEALFERDGNRSLELCLQAKDSRDYSRKWFPSQCRRMPDNFASLPKVLRLDRRRTKTRSFFAPSSVLRLVSDSILITLCIFLGVCFRKLNDFEVWH